MYVQLTYSVKLDDMPEYIIEQLDKLLKIIDQKKMLSGNLKEGIKRRKFLTDSESLKELKIDLDKLADLEQDFSLYFQNVSATINGLLDGCAAEISLDEERQDEERQDEERQDEQE